MELNKSWVLTSYTDNTWTTLVGNGGGEVSSIVMANQGANPVTVEVRLYDVANTTVVSHIIPSFVISSNEAYAIEAPICVEKDRYAIQVRCSASGLHFLASGKI